MTPTDTNTRYLTLVREFNAPRQRVYDAWTKPELMKQWLAPKGYTIPYCTVDLRVGGATKLCMRSPEGHEHWSAGVYQELDPPKKLVTTDYFCDKDGNKISPSELGAGPDFPDEMTITVTFEESNGKTKVTVVQTMPEELAKKIGAFAGWNSSLDNLAALLTQGGAS